MTGAQTANSRTDDPCEARSLLRKHWTLRHWLLLHLPANDVCNSFSDRQLVLFPLLICFLLVNYSTVCSKKNDITALSELLQ